MSLKQRLRTVLCCVVLEMGTLAGIPMRPEQIQELMQSLNQPKVARTDPEEQADGDAPDTGRRRQARSPITTSW